MVLVVDGLGVGAMPDAGDLRPGDLHADTLGHVLGHHRAAHGAPLRLPHLAGLGLGLAHRRPHPHPHADLAAGRPARLALPGATARRAALGYPGADTYAGHQTMMGADFTGVTVARLGARLEEVTRALKEAGHTVASLGGEPLLVVDGHALVHDNLEADPGINWNVSARLSDLPFTRILGIARTVRAVAPIARVIAVGGYADGPLSAAVRHGDGGTVGLDTPASGFYRNGGLRVQHLGAPLDHARQLPGLAARAGIPVTLVGKAADILACETAVRRPAVPTAEVLAHTLAAVRTAGPGADALVVANVQESDLAGHQQDPDRYAAVLAQVDAGLGALTGALEGPGDCLIVTGDHGNDPTIGHAHHTREYVPVLVRRAGASSVTNPPLPDAASLADVGATAAHALGLNPADLAQGAPL